MSVLALITSSDEIERVIPWAAEFAAARDTKLIVLCWTHAPSAQFPLLSGENHPSAADPLVADVRRLLQRPEDENGKSALPVSADKVQVRGVMHPDAFAATLEQVRLEDAELLVAAAGDSIGATGATYSSNPLLRGCPCNTIILFNGPGRCLQRRRVLVYTADNPHDLAAVSLTGRLAKQRRCWVTLARVEEEGGDEVVELGRREIQQLMRDVSLKPNDRLKRKVFVRGDAAKITASAEKHDLVLIGANDQQAVTEMLAGTTKPVVGVIKRSAPLRSWRSKRTFTPWIPRLNAADFADLIQGLRRGSRLNADFLIMLGLAAAIASLGLLQDSPAVIIGSMLLAPLMTPMIASGLALAQANEKLGKSTLLTTFWGFLVTLAVSATVALTTPGREMTSEVVARGDPNLLDLLVALCSGAAAAYALARPSLVGAVAGVAIATALVPPLCAVGISLAYGNLRNGQGAALLFATNFVAIVLAAAGTFRALGVTAVTAGARQRTWVQRSVIGFALAVFVLSFPLEQALQRQIEQGKPQPGTYPLTKRVEEALRDHIRKTADVDLVASGRPSSLHAEADVVIFLASPRALPESYADEIVEIVQREMGDESLIVAVHCLRTAWRR